MPATLRNSDVSRFFYVLNSFMIRSLDGGCASWLNQMIYDLYASRGLKLFVGACDPQSPIIDKCSDLMEYSINVDVTSNIDIQYSYLVSESAGNIITKKLGAPRGTVTCSYMNSPSGNTFCYVKMLPTNVRTTPTNFSHLYSGNIISGDVASHLNSYNMNIPAHSVTINISFVSVRYISTSNVFDNKDTFSAAVESAMTASGVDRSTLSYGYPYDDGIYLEAVQGEAIISFTCPGRVCGGISNLNDYSRSWTCTPSGKCSGSFAKNGLTTQCEATYLTGTVDESGSIVYDPKTLGYSSYFATLEFETVAFLQSLNDTGDTYDSSSWNPDLSYNAATARTAGTDIFIELYLGGALQNDVTTYVLPVALKAFGANVSAYLAATFNASASTIASTPQLSIARAPSGWSAVYPLYDPATNAASPLTLVTLSNITGVSGVQNGFILRARVLSCNESFLTNAAAALTADATAAQILRSANFAVGCWPLVATVPRAPPPPPPAASEEKWYRKRNYQYAAGASIALIIAVVAVYAFTRAPSGSKRKKSSAQDEDADYGAYRRLTL